MTVADTKIRRGTGRPTDRVEGEVRARIISVAARVFSQNGYSGASIQEIVDAAGTTKPMVYYYFKNKEGLYQEIFRSVHQAIGRAQDAVVKREDLSIREKLVAIVATHFKLGLESPERARFMFAAHFGPRRAMPAVHDPECEDVMVGTLVRLAADGVERGELTGDPVAIAQALLGQIMIHLTFHLSDEKPIRLTDASAESVVDLLWQGVGI